MDGSSETEKSKSNRNDSNGNPSCQEEEINILFYDNVVHYREESTFSQYEIKANLDGLKNFFNIILIISVGRLVIENMTNYGLQMSPIRWLDAILDPSALPVWYTILFGCFFAILSLIMERLYVFYLESMGRMSQEYLPKSTMTFSQHTKAIIQVRYKTFENEERIFEIIWMSMLTTMLMVPIAFSFIVKANPYLTAIICLGYCAGFLKLYSYHQVNKWWRTGQLYDGLVKATPDINEKMELYQGETLRAWNPEKLTIYPHNLTLKNILVFVFLPTLCYQCNFPMKKTRNWSFMLRCLIELILLVELICVLSQLWIIIPLQENSFNLSNVTPVQFFLRWTKMSLATISIWLLLFYAIFQSFLNLLAEILYFGDRLFYQDWWNSRTISQFWRKWNPLVHRWCKRHLLKPLLLRGYTHFQGSAIIFFFSGIFHEYLISVPLCHLSIHFVAGMSVQIFLEIFISNIRSWHVANAMVWLSLILGQPLLLILYYNDVLNAQYS